MAWAPSSSTWAPCATASWSIVTVSATNGCRRAPYSVKRATMSSTSSGSPPACSITMFSAIARARTVVANESRSTTSPTRTPTRRALSAYAGPMPFSVVPILSSPRIASAIASCAWCHGKMRWARLDTVSPAHADAARLERVDLAEQRGQVDHHAVADHRDDVVVRAPRSA